MQSDSPTLLLVSALVFVCVTLLILSVLRTLVRRRALLRRYGSLGTVSESANPKSAGPHPPWISIDAAQLGVNAGAQRVLRAELIRAGFFNASALPAYAGIRLALLVSLPAFGMLAGALAFRNWGVFDQILMAAVLVTIGYYLPKAYLSRQRRRLEAEYRMIFPDFLDMLVVCVNAGLSLDAALDRSASEFDETFQEFRANLDLMADEIRAGKSMTDALKAFSVRLGLREARSFAALLQQTIELGTDVVQALTAFSDEMRDKRMSRAEEKAAALPPKLTLPLGLFIFPVVLIVILTPAVIKVMSAVGQ